jgi:Flp pilus assembly protein CpaB
VRNRSNLLVLLGIAFFVVGGIIVYVLTNDDDGGAPTASSPVTVIVATHDISSGTKADDAIEQGDVKATKVPAGLLVPGAVQSLEQLKGATFAQGFAADQQITTGGVASLNRGYTVPEGYEAIAVRLSFPAGGAGYVNTGDRINLYGVYSSAYPIKGVTTPRAELLLTNVLVLDANMTIPANGVQSDASQRPAGDDIVYLLAVKTADAEKVVFNTSFENLYATLVADDAAPAGPTPGQSGDTILSVEPNVAAG